MHRKIVSKSFKFIKIALKLLLENNNKISFFHFSPARPETAKTNSAQSSLRAAGRTQAATWAWADKVPRALAPAWVGELAQRIAAVRLDPTAERPFRADQKARYGRRPGKP